MDPSTIPVTELLPHGREITVIDRLVSYHPSKSVAVVTVGPRNVFFEQRGVPAWVGIEYMAQTVAAHAGFAARLRGEPPAIGFLLGTRRYESTVAEFPDGSVLTVSAERLLMDGGVGSFKCSIETDRVLATAVITTYEPSAAELARLRAAT